jgi:hypothetical protein
MSTEAVNVAEEIVPYLGFHFESEETGFRSKTTCFMLS